jgi:hypothetical protein
LDDVRALQLGDIVWTELSDELGEISRSASEYIPAEEDVGG